MVLKEVSKDIKISKAVCPVCGKKIHSVGFMENSKCEGITVVCKFCGRVFEIVK